jgi:hypothetical protein
MGDSSTGSDSTSNSDSNARWALLGLGGALSLCCLFAAPATSGVAGGVAGGGATAALGGGLVRVVVAGLTVGVLAGVLRYRRSRSRPCDCEG